MTLENYQLSQDLSYLPVGGRFPSTVAPAVVPTTRTPSVPTPPENNFGYLLAIIFAFLYFQK